jgi:hypothetical protein
MALIGITGDRDCDIETCNLSEVHYVLRPGCSYVTIEFAVAASQDISKFILCIHGRIETTKDEIKKQETSPSYSELFKLCNCNLAASNGVYDFRDTWGLDAITNQCYEGPDPFNKISIVITGQQLKYYGCLAHIPEVKFERGTLDGCTLVYISRKEGNNFEKQKLYAFRLGFFLRWPEELFRSEFGQAIKQFLKGPKPFNYSVHTLSCPAEAEAVLGKRTDIKNRLGRNHLCLDLSPFIKRYAEENPSSPILGILDKWADEPTSDLWILIPETDTLDIELELLEGASELSLSTVRYGLYTQQDAGALLPYREYHIKYKKNIRPLMGMKNIKPTDQISLQFASLWRIKMGLFDLRSWLRTSVKNAGVLAVILAIVCAFGLDLDWVMYTVIGLPIAYLALLLITGLRQNVR